MSLKIKTHKNNKLFTTLLTFDLKWQAMLPTCYKTRDV